MFLIDNNTYFTLTIYDSIKLNMLSVDKIVVFLASLLQYLAKDMALLVQISKSGEGGGQVLSGRTLESMIKQEQIVH